MAATTPSPLHKGQGHDADSRCCGSGDFLGFWLGTAIWDMFDIVQRWQCGELYKTAHSQQMSRLFSESFWANPEDQWKWSYSEIQRVLLQWVCERDYPAFPLDCGGVFA